MQERDIVPYPSFRFTVFEGNAKLMFLTDTQCVSRKAWSSSQFVTQVVDFLAFDALEQYKIVFPLLSCGRVE